MKLLNLLRTTVHKLRSVQLSSDERGAVASEYVVLVGVVGIGCRDRDSGDGTSFAIVYERARGNILSPLP